MPFENSTDQPAQAQQTSDNRPDFSQATDARSNFNDLQQSARDNYTRGGSNDQSIDFSQHGDIYASNSSNNNFGRSDNTAAKTGDNQNDNGQPKSASDGNKNESAQTKSSDGADSTIHPGMSQPSAETLKAEKEEAQKDTRTDPMAKVENEGAPGKFAREADDAYKALPDNVKNYLDQNKLKIKAEANLGDSWPEVKDQQLQGYPKGATLANTQTSAFNAKRNEIGLSARDNDNHPAETVGHEVGHAIDEYQGKPSQSPEFKEAYDKDMANMRDEEKVALGYLTINDSAQGAKSETFAQLASDKFSNNPNKSKELYAASRYFPETSKFVNRVIDDIK
ncbi:MAG: hypothetical protein KGS72_03425 [Cyanobacteria bacterium REEB67]|nr:hypothetical protein [Cyanobacteria bacterium REEB67]